jgi:hypothetical protein
MGVNWHLAKFLSEARAAGLELGNVATIGRLNFFTSRAKVRELLRRAEVTPVAQAPENAAEWTYCEPYLSQIGAQSVESIDASSYESATIVADMNQPLPDALHERFDTVIDGGTIEHVFDIKLGLSNEMSLVKEGGHLIIHTMANNWLGHGFYQFSPELFYRVFTEQNGYRVVRMIMHESREFARWYEIPDPAEIRSRIELSNAWLGIGIIIHAQRVAIKPLFTVTPQQSDYAMSWDEAAAQAADAAQQPNLAKQGRARALINIAKRKLPQVLALKHNIMLRYPVFGRWGNTRKVNREHKQRSFAAQPEKFKPQR